MHFLVRCSGCSGGYLLRHGRIVASVIALVLALVPVPSVSQGPGLVSFAQDRIVVDEDASASLYNFVSLPLLREGGTSGAVAVNIQVLDDPDSDFETQDLVGLFLDGSSETAVPVIITNDDLPEDNETFTWTIISAGAAQIGARRSLEMIISASDQPHGLLQFDSDSLALDATEPTRQAGQATVLTVRRGLGTFGRVSVEYEVLLSDESVGRDDLGPLRGQLVFTEGVVTQNIILEVLPDDVPESDELFFVHLINPTGGVALEQENTVASVTVLANDAPLHWSEAVTSVREDSGVVQLTLIRGLHDDENMAGLLRVQSTVQVTTTSGSATSGSDFTPVSRVFTFPPSVSSIQVPVNIINDTLAEGDEIFTVVLSSPSADAILSFPSTATIIIEINDNAGGLVSFVLPGPVVLQEDQQTSGFFIIRRTVGTFGDLTVEWQITNNADTTLATSDFQLAQGNLTIIDGDMDALLTITALDDHTPEVSESFTVKLVRVVSSFGGLSDRGRLASLIVADSDDVYGLLDWAQDNLLSIVGSAPRELRLAVNRTGDAVGIVSVDYSILYLPAGGIDPTPVDASMALVLSGSVQLQGKQTIRNFSVTIDDTAFLEAGGQFMATLDNVTIVGGVTFLIQPTNSPRIGPRNHVLLQVPATATSGLITFATGSTKVSVAESDSAITFLTLNVERSGSFGLATIIWSVRPQSAGLTDLGSTAGTVVIPNGGNRASFQIPVLPDDQPELDETFSVSLIAVMEANQMIFTEQHTSIVTILANDDPSGIFSISNATRGPFYLNEGNNIILTITIIRIRGALTNELIRYMLIGEVGEIAGGQGLADFQPGEREVTVTLLVVDDSIPELNETFMFTISALDSRIQLSMPITVDITILANDHYAGLFAFNTSSLTSNIVEPRSSSAGLESIATLVVVRCAGTFGSVDISWMLTNPSSDIQEGSGVVSFSEGQWTASFELLATPDDVPEGPESFTVQLGVLISGQGMLAPTSTTATVTILQNDDPISFNGSVLEVQEGDTGTFSIIRVGPANDMAEVEFEVVYNGTSPGDVQITPSRGVVELVAGQVQASLSVAVLDDSVPEVEELLGFRLISTTGDTVLGSSVAATLIIPPNDAPNGIFSFSVDSLMVDIEEGQTIELIVTRDGGSFGSFSLYWTIYSVTSGTRSSADVLDVTPQIGILNFGPGVLNQAISLRILDDSIPELAELLEVELSFPTVQVTTHSRARLGNNTVATVVIGDSDEPHGVLVVTAESSMLVIAEDIPPDNTVLGTAGVQISRAFGTIGNVLVLWEVLPLADSTLPQYIDLLFFGKAGLEVTTAIRRPNTGTTALRFSGQAGSVVTVPMMFQPSNTNNGFTISMWLQPSSTVNGALLAKSAESGIIYSLNLVSDESNFLIQFSYQQSVAGQILGIGTAEVSVLKSSFTDGNWHSLVVIVTGERVLFYADNNLIASRVLHLFELMHEQGVLTVGGETNINFYAGDLQDVRIYSGELQLSQIEVVSTEPAVLSLTPISGYISFASGTSMATISVMSVDDLIPEPSETLVLSLANVDGGARFGSQDSAIITVLKSDSSNGVFGFGSVPLAISIDEKVGMVTLSVNRSKGNFGGVEVTWEVRAEVSETTALQDFDPVIGRVVFQEGEQQREFTIRPLDDMQPELSEIFVIVLTSAVANDNQTSSTTTSGASIDDERSRFFFTVMENDFPYGILQFAGSSFFPTPPISLATTMPELTVEESDGAVRVYVVRAQGVVGNVSCEFFTRDDTATKLGLMPDYISTAGKLDFLEGVQVLSFDITLVDDSDPELAKIFFVNLTNPQGDSGEPGLAIGQSMAITILPSDNAFGRFSFSEDSLSFVVIEQPEGTPVTLTVVRDEGKFETVTVSWLVSRLAGQVSSADITPTSGQLVFAEQQSQQQFTITVNDDRVAELEEVFTVTLLNASVGASIGALAASTITVKASDHPYGLFAFSSTYRPFEVEMESGRIEVVVTREFGSLGQVMVDIQVLPTHEATMLVPGSEELLTNKQLATNIEDYGAMNVTLTFENGETSQSFYINIIADAIPEIDEYFFAVITRVELNKNSLTSVDSSVLPLIAPDNNSVAIFIITENDDARGLVQLLQPTFSVVEPSHGSILVQRSKGLFGNITVRWQAIPGKASLSDFSPSGGLVILPDGVSIVTLPLVILNDNVPEFPEEFTVELLSVSGGGRLGPIRSSSVIIQSNDNPNGVLDFASGSQQLSVEEPEDGNPARAITLIVHRSGGTQGVVSVSWRVTSSSGDASSDMLPVAGTLQFITAATQQSFILSVLPDMVPELNEVFTVELLNATGGVSLGRFPAIKVTVPANDGPHGVVSLASPLFTTFEVGDNGTSTAMLTVTRSIGFFGDVRVLFNVQSADPAILAMADGTPTLLYYTASISNSSLPSSSLLRSLFSSLSGCARSCLSDRACLSFSVHENSGFCNLFIETLTQDKPVNSEGFEYYQKLQDAVLVFYQSVASAGNDFVAVVGQFIIMPDGAQEASLPVIVMGDTVAELNESLIVTLTNVQLNSSTVFFTGDIATNTAPILGNITESTLIILENDAPRGEFILTAADGNAEVHEEELDDFSLGISLTVTRERGSIGRVSVTWSVSGGTAEEGQDFIGTGATLVFDEGEMEAMISLVILADDIPEVDETVVISLSNPTNGASLAAGGGSRVTVIIDANDGVAGVVGLTPLSRSAVVAEGERTDFELTRTLSAKGQVEVDWTISGTGEPALEFGSIRGTATFLNGENTTTIAVTVLSDTTPELAERYTLTLNAIRTLSDSISSRSGAAMLDPQAATATITIRASNNPHGQIDFQASSLSITTGEGQSPQLTIIRQFGTFGVIDITYIAENVSGSGLGSEINPASDGMDFVSEQRTVRLEDGQQSTVISIQIIDDSDAEVAEVLFVYLTSVNLVGGAENRIPPSLGMNVAAQITILPNDSPQGIITFIQQSYFVSENVGSVDIAIRREQGTVGTVSAVYFTINQQALNNVDYLVEPLDEVAFVAGQSERNISVSIVNDLLPEIEETFCIALRLPMFGAIIGRINRTCITILPNDDPYGSFSFSLDSLQIILQETQGTATSSNVAELHVVRSGGSFGSVTVPFVVEAVGSAGSELADLSPVRGALLFLPKELFKVLQIEAVTDTIPELAEFFSVSLLPSNILGHLSDNNTMASIEVVANQDPHGVFQLNLVREPLVGSRLLVEEDMGYIDFEVTRSGGTFGEVLLTLETISRTATFADGQVLNAATSQALYISPANIWFSFLRSTEEVYAILGTSMEVLLYGWRGVFTVIQTLAGSGVAGVTHFSPTLGEDVLVVANGGSEGNREIMSNVYTLGNTEELTVVQALPTAGASDVTSFQSLSEWHVVVANSEDNAGNPNVYSVVYRWNGTMLLKTQMLATIGASALEIFTIDNTLYLAVTSLTDTRSQVFLWRNGHFRLDHTFHTERATDIIFLSLGPFLIVTSNISGVAVLMREETGNFVTSNSLSRQAAIKVERLGDREGTTFVVTFSVAPAQMFLVDASTSTANELMSVSLPVSRHVYPIVFPSGDTFLAAAGTSLNASIIYEVTGVEPSSNDFYHRNITLMFRPGEAHLMLSIAILNDALPEVDEEFQVALRGPSGGARLGVLESVEVVIQSNDDAHGVVGFANDSLSIVVVETSADVIVVVMVERSSGTFSQVAVGWELAGVHAVGEISPSAGQVTFPAGVASSSITLSIRADNVPELNEISTISLTSIIESGIPATEDQSRGVRLFPGHTEAVITVQANDAPYGVIYWSSKMVLVDEEEGINNVLQLVLIREFGDIGTIVISYATGMAQSLPSNEHAFPLSDFVPASGDVVMSDGQTSGSVFVTILQDNVPEANESFIVNITGVRIADEADRQGSVVFSPRVGDAGGIVEVVIRENDNNRGLLYFDTASVSIAEIHGVSVNLQVIRSRGSFGSISVHYMVNEGSAISADFNVPLTGTLTFETGQRSANFTITIVDDQIPELDEAFEVDLVNVMGGGEIGQPSSVAVTILKNDDINGRFFFADGSLLVLTPESGVNSSGKVTLVVKRQVGLVGETIIYWAVSTNGRLDLEPASGNLTFAENISQQMFTIEAVEDGIPELLEAFAVLLVAAEGGGRIVDPRESRVAIQASDDPTGVLGLEQFPEGVTIDEGDIVQVNVIRSAGTQGTVTVTWTITPPEVDVFTTVSDTVILTNGQIKAEITIQTLSDNIPEVQRSYFLRVVSSTVARIDVTATDVEIIVRASDNPHGTVEFSSAVITTPEGAGHVQLPVVRLQGLVGVLQVNFTVLPSTSADATDYNFTDSYLIFPSEMSTAAIMIYIVDDILPELDEIFFVHLTSVEILDDLEEGSDLPTLGAHRDVQVTILSSDEPYGNISLVRNLYNIVEGAMVSISLIRVGGSLGIVTLSYTTANGTATSPGDYTELAGTIVFTQGQTAAELLVSTNDDDDSEVVEDFSFILLGVTEGFLGNISTATVLIEASDSPFGVVGFLADAGVTIDNPTQSPAVVSLTVRHSGHTLASTDITWNITGSNGAVPFADIAPDSLGGALTLADGQSTGVIQITVLPTATDELEETFIISLVGTTNDVTIDSELRTAAIIVRQNGSPFGTISFLGEALMTQQVKEESTSSTLSLPLERDGQLFLTVGVSYIVSREDSTDPVGTDVVPVSGMVMFPPLQGRVSIDLSIIPDDDAEADETFLVTLLAPTGGANINPQASRAVFIISNNGNLYGVFGVVNASISVSGTTGQVVRKLGYTMVRVSGEAVDTDITIQHAYNKVVGAEVVPAMITQSMKSSVSTLEISVPITPGAFLFPGSVITVSILNITVSSPADGAGTAADISVTADTAQATVKDSVANIVIGFMEESLIATVNEDTASENVVLKVFRRGMLGDVDVSWLTGASASSVFRSGDLFPLAGTKKFTPGQNTTALTFNASPANPHGEAEIFVVTLRAISLDHMFPSRVYPIFEQSLIEPFGVFQLGNSAYSGVEGTMVSVSVWRRFGSMGSVTIHGLSSALLPSNLSSNHSSGVVSAKPTSDFSSTSLSLVLQEGMTTGFFNITLPNNDIVNSLKVFQFSLISVQRSLATSTAAQSPRLAADNTTATVSIIDDEGGSGLFQLNPISATAAEGSSVTFSVIRSRGTSGHVSIMLQTHESGLATTGADFEQLNTELTFENGVSQILMSVDIFDDDTPEPAEGFSISLSPPSNQVVLIDPNATTLRVEIELSDYPAGLFSIDTPSLNLTEDGTPSLSLTEDGTSFGVLVVRRVSSMMGVVTITWEALYTDGLDHAVSVADILISSRGTITFGAGSAIADSDIILQLRANGVPASGEQFSVRLSSSAPGVGFAAPSVATVIVHPRRISVFEITDNNLTRLVTSATDNSLVLEVRRRVGLQVFAQVSLKTVQLTRAVTVGGLTLQPAQQLVHFAVSSVSHNFDVGEETVTVLLEVIISVGTTPLAFLVVLESTSHQVVSDTVTIVISPPGPLSSLYSLYFEAVALSNSQRLQKVSTDLLQALVDGSVTGRDRNQSDLVRLIDDELIRKTLVPVNIDFSSTTYVSHMLDSFDRLVSDSTFSGRSLLADTMKLFAYSLLEDIECNSTAITHSRNTFFFLAVKSSPASLAGRRFTSNTGPDYVQFPNQIILSAQAVCVNVHYIDFFNGSLFLQPTFLSKVLSIGIQNITLLRTSEPVIYRIHSNRDMGLLPDRDDCLLWQYPVLSGSGSEEGNSWDSTLCSPQTHFVMREDFIQCACRWLGDVAVSIDVAQGYGWTLPAGLSAAMCIVTLLMSVTLHFVYLSRTQLASRLLLCLCMAVLAHQLILLVDIYASQAGNVSANGCVVMGALLQLTVITQFVFIVAMVFSLWANFIGCTTGNESLIIYILISLGAPVLIVIGTVLIGHFTFGLELNSSSGLYGPIKSLCFMPVLSALLLSTVLPITLCLLVMVSLLSHTYFYWSRWGDVRSIYYATFNRTEIPLLIGFFAFIVTSTLTLYLHVFMGLVYTFGAFVILNTILGLYVLVVYFFMSWHTLTSKHSKCKISEDVEITMGEDLVSDGDDISPIILPTSSPDSSCERPIDQESEYSRGDSSVVIVPLGMDQVESKRDLKCNKHTTLSGEEGKEDTQIDDLLFMLKTQNFSGSFGSSDSDQTGLRSQQMMLGKPGADHFEPRRITIADTHL